MAASERDVAPVLIVGSGPVGLTLALELARQGVASTVVTEALTTSTHPKCNTTNARSMEHFRRLGLAREIRFGGLPADYSPDIVYLTRLAQPELARVRFPSPRQSADGRDASWQTPEPQHRISQIFLERILLARVLADPRIRVRFGLRVEGLEERPEVAVLVCRPLEGGDPERIAGRYVVGCDGARSTIRRLSGIRLIGEARARRAIFGGEMLATYYSSPELAELLRGREGFMYWTLNTELRSVTVAIDGAERFLTHVQAPEGVAADDLRPESFLPRIVGRPFAYEILSSASWTAGYRLVAERFVSGRIALAGDAAHLFTPTGGFGMNTGLDDAANLGWKLAALVSGWGGGGLLESYDAERRPVAHRNTEAANAIADIIGNFEVPDAIEAPGDAGRAARAAVAAAIGGVATEEFQTVGVQLGVRYEGSPIVVPDGTPPPADLRTRYEPTARPGSRLPHVPLDAGVSLFDRLGVGFTLLQSTPAAGRLEAIARGLRVPLDVAPMPGEVAAALGARFVLVRPDQHVAWRGDRLPADLASLLSLVTGGSPPQNRVAGR